MEKFQIYLQYIVNTGGKVSQYDFIDDWNPIGAMLLNDMYREGLILLHAFDLSVELSRHGIAVLEELKNA